MQIRLFKPWNIPLAKYKKYDQLLYFPFGWGIYTRPNPELSFMADVIIATISSSFFMCTGSLTTISQVETVGLHLQPSWQWTKATEKGLPNPRTGTVGEPVVHFNKWLTVRSPEKKKGTISGLPTLTKLSFVLLCSKQAHKPYKQVKVESCMGFCSHVQY